MLKIVDYNSCVTHLELFPTLSRVFQMCGFSSPLSFYEQYNMIVHSANSEHLQEELDDFYIQVGKEHILKSILILIQSYLLFIEKVRDDVWKKLNKYGLNLLRVSTKHQKHMSKHDKILTDIRLENVNYTPNLDWTTIKLYKGKKSTYPSRFKNAQKNPLVLKRYNCVWENRYYLDNTGKMSQAEANVTNAKEKLECYKNYIHFIKTSKQILSD